jgi:hypothetical protein
LQSKAHRGGDKEPTLAYIIVRRGERRGDNKGVQMKATWYQAQQKGARWGEKIAPFALFSFRLIAEGRFLGRPLNWP